MLGLRILLVDDEQYALSRLLQCNGHEVYAAMTIREAIWLAWQGRCDLLIADFELPDGTAMDLMRELRSVYPLPGIVLTGYEGEEYKARSRAAGFGKHLVKPIHFDDLVAAIADVVPAGPNSGAVHRAAGARTATEAEIVSGTLRGVVMPGGLPNDMADSH